MNKYRIEFDKKQKYWNSNPYDYITFLENKLEHEYKQGRIDERKKILKIIKKISHKEIKFLKIEHDRYFYNEKLRQKNKGYITQLQYFINFLLIFKEILKQKIEEK